MVTRVAQALGGSPNSRLIGCDSKVAAANAVLANGTLAHGLDYDDTLEEAIVHTGCCAGMTALAVGEEVSAGGRSVLEAAVAGTEVMCKIGIVAPGKFHARGFHPTALCSTFGIIEYMADGTWTKRMHPGWAAHGGVIATLLACEGFRGPEKVFEGTHGFFQSFGGPTEYRFEKLLELGKIGETPRLTFKSYPCGSISHPYMDCALKLRLKYAPAPEQIVEVVCRTAQGPVHRLWEPLADKQRPASSYGAKFSLPYCIAVMLIRGRAGLEEFTDEAILEPSVRALARKVRYELDSTIDYPRHFSGHVKICLADGSVLEANQAHPRGGFEDPLPPEEIEAKFRANASLRLPRERADQIIEAVARLEEMPNVTSLADLLKP